RSAVDLGRIDFFHVPTDRVWVRDSGPIFLTADGGEVALTGWKFNAWAKYDNWQNDDTVAERVRTTLGLRLWRAPPGPRHAGVGAGATWSWRGGASTSTAAGCC